MKKRRGIVTFVALLMAVEMLLSLVPFCSLKAEAREAEDRAPSTRAVSVGSVSVPDYSGGTSSGWMTYDCGANLSRGDTGTQSKMRIVKNTTATQFNTYVSTLKSKGYQSLYEKKVPAQSNYNLHHKFLSPDGTYVVYTYFVDTYKETRIIVDTNRDTLRILNYKSMGLGSGNGRTEVYMIPVSASRDGFYYDSAYSVYKRDNAGAFLVMKMADNSLFIMDGGGYMQMSDRDCERIYAFLREITGIPEGQKIYINTWFMTHYHDDHIAGIPRFLYKYNTEFELQNIMYNFDVVGYSGDNMQIMGELFPNAKYYKQHTGESFKICDVQFDVLYTVEDFYTPNSSNNLITDDTSCYKKSDEENNCSSVLRVTFDGKTMLLTGDIHDSDTLVMGMYPAKDLHADIMQLPHHAYDNHATFVKTVAPTISFLHQVESAVRNRQTLYNNNQAWMPYAGTIYYGNSELVGYCAEEGIFLRKPFTEDVDWMGWGNKTWELEEANPYTSDPVADPEKYYRYTQTNALTTSTKAYAIVDDKLGYPLAFDAVSGKVSNATPGFHDGDSYYFAASQRRLVNWNMSYSSKGTNANALVTGATTYYGGLPISKGTGDYWGTSTKNTGITLGNGDTFQSKGMYSSWCSFTDQLESKSQWTWMDALSDGTVLLYRRADSIYYPLYRDSNAVPSGGSNNTTGWGTAKLSKSQINNKQDYFALRLYAYTGTADTLLLQWSGHKDYYANAGISQSQLLSLLTADIRVNYSFSSFPGTGEISYDMQKDSATFEAGTYRFSFTKTFAGSTPGDYPVVIQYMTHTGTILELGTFTVHILDRSSDPATQSLFMDFNDDAVSRKKYQYDPQYKGINFDSSSHWQFIEYNYATEANVMTEGFVDTLSGTMKIYTKAQDTVVKTLSARSYVNGYGHLKYDPKNAEVVQIRFKMENLKPAEGQEASFSLWYHKNTGSGDVSADEAKFPLETNFVSDGKYITLTVELSDAFRQAGTITGLRPAFFYVIPTDPAQQGCVTIDYLYIGPKDNVPEEENRALFFDFDNSTEAGERYTMGEQYNERNFDSTELLYWATDETSTTAALSADCYVDNEAGTLTVPVAEGLAYGNKNGIYGPWIFTTGVPGVRMDRKDSTYHGLGFEPETGDIIRIRFKVEGCVLATDREPQIVVCYDRSEKGVSGRGSYSMVVDYTLKDGVYQTLTIPVDEEFASSDVVTTMGFRFWHIKSESKGSGKITIDYIYVGPDGDDAPEATCDHVLVEIPGYPATCTESGIEAGLRCELCEEILQESVVIPAMGHTEVILQGKEPTCLSSGLSDGVFCTQCNETLVPQQILPRLGHDYTLYTDLGENHSVRCSRCSGSRTESHRYENGVCPCGKEEETAPVELSELKLSHTLALASDISVNFAVPKSALAGFQMDTVYVECTIDLYEGNTKVGTKVVTLMPVEQGNYYYFTLTGLTAVHMKDRIVSVLYGTKDGQTYCSPVDEYSIATYAYSQLNKEGAADSLKTLCADLLRYGAKSQSFKGYRTDALADEELTQEQRAYLSSMETVTFGNHNRVLTDQEEPAITWAGKALDLNSKVTVKFVFSPGAYRDRLQDLSLRVTYRGVDGTIHTETLTQPELYNADMGVYAFSFSGLLAAELRTVVSARIYEGDTPVSCTLEYSPDTYGNNKTGSLGELCKALFAYSDSARAYFE